jgi:hypothetical protein
MGMRDVFQNINLNIARLFAAPFHKISGADIIGAVNAKPVFLSED